MPNERGVGRPRRVKDIEHRAGNLSDVSGVAQLALSVFGGDAATWRDRFLRSLTREDSYFVVAHTDGVLVGYGKSTECEPALRRRGIGAAGSAPS